MAANSDRFKSIMSTGAGKYFTKFTRSVGEVVVTKA